MGGKGEGTGNGVPPVHPLTPLLAFSLGQSFNMVNLEIE